MPENKKSALPVHLGCLGLVAFIGGPFVGFALGKDYYVAGVIASLIGLVIFYFNIAKHHSGGGDISDVGPP